MPISLITYNKPQSLDSEAYRMLRTNLDYSGVDHKYKSILVTSSKASEGKSTTACNLAVTLAHGKKKVMLMDCDLRRPNIHKLFSVPNSIGLTDYMTKDKSLESVTFHSLVVDGLDVITSGKTPPLPFELLESQKMVNLIQEFKENYDYVIIDSPPVLTVTDAMILAKIVDGVLLCVAANESHIEAAVNAKKSLEKVEAHIMGTVLTKAKLNNKGYYSYNEKGE